MTPAEALLAAADVTTSPDVASWLRRRAAEVDEPSVEIGGVTMTQSQFEAARAPLLQQDSLKAVEPNVDPEDEDDSDLAEDDYLSASVTIERRISEDADQVWVAVEPRGQVSMVEALGLLSMATDSVLRGGVIPGSPVCVMEDAPEEDDE